MDRHGSPNVPVSQSYPSPSAAAVGDGAGPFFAPQHQQRMSPPDELRLAAQMSRAHPAMMGTGPNGPDTVLVMHHQQHPHVSHAPHAHHVHHVQQVQQHHPGAHLRQSGSPVNPYHPAGAGVGPGPGPGSSPVSGAIAGAGARTGLDASQDAAPAEPDTPRKRTKVSRACDECRRKKIRCDSALDDGVQQCSTCKRMGTRCQFSRVPLKRGPSKGYIKELSDRINTLENTINPARINSSMAHQQTDQAAGSPRHLEPLASPTSASSEARANKRSYSAIDESVTSTYAQPDPRRPSGGPWGHETARRLPHPATGSQNVQMAQSNVPGSDYSQPSTQRVQTSPSGVQPSFWQPGSPEAGRRLDGGVFAADPTGIAHPDASFEWNDAVVDCYYENVHETFPMLPHGKSVLRVRLGRCSTNAREAFLGALGLLAATISASVAARQSASYTVNAIKKASDLLAVAQFEGHGSRDKTTNLVYLQTMILMVIQADKRGPSTDDGQVGPARSMWLEAAIGLANALRVNLVGSRDLFAGEDLDSDDCLGRRAWYVMFMLDRWQAISVMTPLMISETAFAAIPEDRALLGEMAFHMAGLSRILGHVLEIIMGDLIDRSSIQRPVICRTMLCELEFFHIGAQTFMQTTPALRLAYMHVTLVVQRVLPHAEPYEVFLPAERLMLLLNSFGPGDSVSVLRHHYISLAALTFSGAADASDTRDRAQSMLDLVVQAIEQRRGFATDEAPSAWDMAIRQLISKRHGSSPILEASTPADPTVRGGLQHLADLAVNQEGVMQGGHESSGCLSPASTLNDSGSEAFFEAALNGLDASKIMGHGYLAFLADITKDVSSSVTVAPFSSDTGNAGGATTTTANVNTAPASANVNDVAVNGNGSASNGDANGRATANHNSD